jgi:hypothetical protein
MPIVSMGRVFPRQILSPSKIFVKHSKLLLCSRLHRGVLINKPFFSYLEVLT